MNLQLAFLVAVAMAGLVWVDSLSSNEDPVKEACSSMSKYADLCMSELGPFTECIKTANDPEKEIMKHAVSRSLGEARQVASWARQLVKQRQGEEEEKEEKPPMDSREKAAMKDCAEVLDNARSLIHDSLATLKHLRKERLSSQLSDVKTWLSAALDDESTCVSGFNDVGKTKSCLCQLLTERVSRVSSLVSMSLALVNNYSASSTSDRLDL